MWLSLMAAWELEVLADMEQVARGRLVLRLYLRKSIQICVPLELIKFHDKIIQA